MSEATFAKLRATHTRLELPPSGAGWCEATLDEEATLSGTVTLTLSDASQLCTIVSGGAGQGGAHYRAVAGYGGWRKRISKRAYANDAGVRIATILRDAAADAGEQIATETLPSGSVGISWVREAGAASETLHLLAPGNWYVDAAGITRIGSRNGAEISGEAARGELDLAAGRITLAADSIATIAPGCIVDGRTIADVHHVLEGTQLRSTCYFASAEKLPRRVAAQARMLRAVFADYRYRGLYEFRVVTQTGDRVDLQPVRSTLGFPDLRRVKISPGLPGCTMILTPGSLVRVAFINADPSRPEVVGFGDAEAPGFMPLQLQLGEGLGLGIARMTDPVQAGPFSGVIVGGSVRIKAVL